VNPSDIMRGLSISQSAFDSLNEETRRKSHAADSINFLADLQRASLASAFAEKLRMAILHFDASLDADHEVGMRLVTFGQAITFHVEDVRYHNPSLIFFRGTTDDGHRVELIQHLSQISFLLLKLPKPDPNQPKRRFGFYPPEHPTPGAPDPTSPAPAGGV